MLFGKKAAPPLKNTSPKITMAGTKPNPNPILGEIQKLIWFAMALTLFLALVSYSPQDPSWTTWSSKNQFQNWLGRSGSVVSDLLFQLFGLASFLIAGLFTLFALEKNLLILKTPHRSAL
ncbi:hypothetical protein EBQ74_10000 [bacterium]|nr:hypothetical protein [bacterium]